MTFTPSGVLRNDYSAFCESLRLIEREDMYSAISCQPRRSCEHHHESQKEQQQQPLNHQQQQEEINKKEVIPLTHFTCVKMRHPGFCVNHRDIAPLTMAMPFCTSLVYIELTGCGLSELAYHKLVEAVYKSLRVLIVKVDFNSPGNKGFYEDPLLSNAGDVTPTILLKPTEFCGLHCFPTALEEQIREEKQKKGKVDSKKIQQLQSQSELVEQFNKTHAFAIPKRWAGIFLTGIAHLSLRGNGITDDDVKNMVEIILSHKYLQLVSLNLWDNKINDTGATDLARLLRENNTLRMLDVGHNTLSDEGMLTMIDTLRMQEVHGMNELLARRRKILARPNALLTERQWASQAIAGNILSYQDLFYVWYVDHFPLSSSSTTTSSHHLDDKNKENNNNSNNAIISSASNSNKKLTSSSSTAPSSSAANANTNAAGISSNYVSSTSGGKNRNKTDPQQTWIAMIKQMVRPTALFDRYCVKVGNPMFSLSSNTMINTNTTSTSNANANTMNSSTSNTCITDEAQNAIYRVPGNTIIEVLNLSENKHVTLNGVREVKRRLSLHEPHSEDEMMALCITKTPEEVCHQCVLPSPSKHGRRKSSNIAQHLNSSMSHAGENMNNYYNNNTTINTNSPSNRSLSQSNVEMMNKIPHVHVPELYCVHLHLTRCDVRSCHEFNRNEWDEMNKLQEEINTLLAERLHEVNKQEDEIRARERADAEEAQRRAASATPSADSRHGSAKRK